MKAGDVVFVKPSGFISRMVALIDGGPYSHVAMAVNETHIVEAQYFTRSRITPAYARDVLVLDLGLSDEQRAFLQQQAIMVTGRWYDYRLIVHYFVTNALKWNLKAIWNSQNNLICSELVAGLLISVGYEGAAGLSERNITPRELFEHLTKYQLQKAGEENVSTDK